MPENQKSKWYDLKLLTQLAKRTTHLRKITFWAFLDYFKSREHKIVAEALSNMHIQGDHAHGLNPIF